MEELQRVTPKASVVCDIKIGVNHYFGFFDILYQDNLSFWVTFCLIMRVVLWGVGEGKAGASKMPVDSVVVDFGEWLLECPRRFAIDATHKSR